MYVVKLPRNICEPEPEQSLEIYFCSVKIWYPAFILETGHFNSVPEEDGGCYLCILNEVENLIFYCPFDHDLRVKFCPETMCCTVHPILFNMTDEQQTWF